MSSTKRLLLMVMLLALAGNVWAQRKSQIEFYAGSAFPLSPDDFKEYTRVGLSGNAQYVLFPSPRLGITLVRLGGGLRPYLTAPEAGTQIFLLGQVNYNRINNNYSATDLPYAYDPSTNFLQWASFDDRTWESTIEENDENVVGFGLGGGLEIPAGTSFNIVLQGLFNIISTTDESTSFMGVTAGLVF